MVCISILGARENSTIALGDFLGALSLLTVSTCWSSRARSLVYESLNFIYFVHASPCFCPFVVSLSLSSCYAPFKLLGAFYYGYTQFNYSSLELIVAFSVFVNAIFAGDGFTYVSCSGEYFKCEITLDHLYLGVSSMHLDILFPNKVLCG